MRLFQKCALLFGACVVVSDMQAVKRVDGIKLDLYVWQCGIDFVREIIVDTLTNYSDVESINKVLTEQVTKKDPSTYWLVFTQKYQRIVAELLPDAAPANSLCVVQVSNENIAVVVAKLKA